MERTRSNSHLFPALLVLVGLLLYVAVVTYDHARRWTDVAEGLLDGLAQSVVYSVGYLFIFVPLTYLILFVTRNRPRSFWLRSLLCLFPVLAVCVSYCGSWYANPISDRACFESTMGFAMPASAKNVKSERSGGGVASITQMYYFEADPDQLYDMLQQSFFKLTGRLDLSTPIDWPATESWNGLVSYQHEDGEWCYKIQTDNEFKQAIVVASNELLCVSETKSKIRIANRPPSVSKIVLDRLKGINKEQLRCKIASIEAYSKRLSEPRQAQTETK